MKTRADGVPYLSYDGAKQIGQRNIPHNVRHGVGGRIEFATQNKQER